MDTPKAKSPLKTCPGAPKKKPLQDLNPDEECSRQLHDEFCQT